jgi:starch synthase
MGHDIRVTMPRYGRIEPARLGITPTLDSIEVPMDERLERGSVFVGAIGSGASRTPVYFVDSPRYFDRQGLYLYPQRAVRLFSPACPGDVPCVGLAA